MISFIKKNLIVGLVYLFLCLAIGENHPFSLVPMYDRFSNWAYVIYFSDQVGKALPSVKQFRIKSADLAHQYSTICERQDIHGYAEQETQSQLQQIGKVLMDKTLTESPNVKPKGILQIHRICYFMEQDTIASHDVIMYETSMNEK